jgi:hypothetical protein
MYITIYLRKKYVKPNTSKKQSCGARHGIRGMRKTDLAVHFLLYYFFKELKINFFKGWTPNAMIVNFLKTLFMVFIK